MTTEEKAAQAAEAEAQAALAAAAEAEAAAAASADPAVLKAKLAKSVAAEKSLRERLKTAEDEKKKLEDERKQAEDARLAEQGKFKELADQRQKALEAQQSELEQLRALKAQKDATEAAARQAREAQVAAEFDALPEAVKSEIPADADPRTKQAAITAYRAALGTKAPPPAATAPRPATAKDEPPPVTDVEWQEWGLPTTPQKRKAEIDAKNASRLAWEQAR